MEDSPMEELVDQGLGMEETGLRRPSFRETYHHDSLLAPDTDFMIGTVGVGWLRVWGMESWRGGVQFA